MGRDGPRDFEKDLLSMSATMVGRRKKYYVSDGLKRPKQRWIFGKIFLSTPSDFLQFCIKWNLANEIFVSFSKVANALIRKEKKKHLCSSKWEKKDYEKWTFFNKMCYKAL